MRTRYQFPVLCSELLARCLAISLSSGARGGSKEEGPRSALGAGLSGEGGDDRITPTTTNQESSRETRWGDALGRSGRIP